MLPTALRIDGFRFFFYSNEGAEPPHVHVEKQGSTAKFWLEPVSIVYAKGFKNKEAKKLERVILNNKDTLLGKWNEYFGIEN